MKMKTQSLFPPVKPNPKFREQLKIEVLEMYNQQRQARFNWRWLVAPGVALASLLFVILVGNGQPLFESPGLVHPPQQGITQSDVPVQNSPQGQQNGDSQSTQLVETPQNLAQLNQELTELSDILNTDTDLEAAIAFKSL